MPRELVIALISAGLALSGVMISAGTNLLIATIDKRHKRQVLLREKFEQMMFHLSDSLTWISDLNGCSTLDDVLAKSQSIDARHLCTLCALYFPELSLAESSYLLTLYRFFAPDGEVWFR